MVSYPCVHHIELGVLDGPGTVEVFKLQYNFKVSAYRHSLVADQWLLVQNDVRFLITSLKTHDERLIQNDPYVANWSSNGQMPSKDSVFNIAFQVKDIDSFVQKLQNQDVILTKPLRTASDSKSSVRTCVVKSCVGDIQHTLIENTGNNSCCLPGFTPVSDDDAKADGHHKSSLLHFDHVALAVDLNTSMSIIAWYERYFGMRRFLINRDEDTKEGLLLSSDYVRLRLRAMEYWKCAEVGLVSSENGHITGRLAMVIGEGLPLPPGRTAQEDQMESWLRQHGGPGIQHIALHTLNIKTAVKQLRLSGVHFAKNPPSVYYSEIGRLHDIVRAGEEVEDLKENGILIDTEADRVNENTGELNGSLQKESYLLQIFTAPVLPKDPFFLELIQREGATGFGSGNVAALYRSVDSLITGSTSK